MGITAPTVVPGRPNKRATGAIDAVPLFFSYDRFSECQYFRHVFQSHVASEFTPV